MARVLSGESCGVSGLSSVFAALSIIDRTNSPKHAIALLEFGDIFANFIHLASHITAQHERPLLDKEAVILDLPVDWIDSDGVVLHNDLVVARAWHISWTNLYRR